MRVRKAAKQWAVLIKLNQLLKYNAEMFKIN